MRSHGDPQWVTDAFRKEPRERKPKIFQLDQFLILVHTHKIFSAGEYKEWLKA